MASPKLTSDQEARSRPAIGESGGNDGIEGRLRHLEQQMARVEVQLEHLATKEGLAEIKTLIEHLATKEGLAEIKTLIEQSKSAMLERESTAMKWLVGILITAVGIFIAAVVAIAVALVRIFM